MTPMRGADDAGSTRLHAHELAARLRAGETSSRDIVLAHLDVAERQNRVLNAWLTIDRERALAEADAADRRLAAARSDGPAAVDALHPLLGIPVALKDLISVEGGQCTAGSRILEGYIAPFDAHITERLRSAGARDHLEVGLPGKSADDLENRRLVVNHQEPRLRLGAHDYDRTPASSTSRTLRRKPKAVNGF